MATKARANTKNELPRDLMNVVSFHGHLCPGLLIGYRAAKAGMKALKGKRSGDEELIAIVENNSCAVDAVQFLTGATFGKGNLFFRDYGKQAFTFAKRTGGRAVRVALKADAFAEPAPSREDRVKMLLSAKDDDLFTIKNVRITLPAEAEIHKSVVCASCGEAVMDTRTKKVKGKVLCIPCAGKV